MWSAARSAKISMILCMPERVSGGDAKFQGFCDGWNKWEGLHPDKTRLIEFGQFALRDRRQRGQGRPKTFDFLGFTHYCTKTRRGYFQLGRKPIAKRMGRTLKWITEALHRRMHHNVKVTAKWLGKVVDGWLNYFAVPNSYRYLERFANCVRRLWLRSLRRRSQKDRTTWADIAALTAAHLAQAGNPTPVAGPPTRRQSNPREKPDALTGTSGSARGAPGNRRPYRDNFVKQPSTISRDFGVNPVNLTKSSSTWLVP